MASPLTSKASVQDQYSAPRPSMAEPVCYSSPAYGYMSHLDSMAVAHTPYPSLYGASYSYPVSPAGYDDYVWHPFPVPQYTYPLTNRVAILPTSCSVSGPTSMPPAAFDSDRERFKSTAAFDAGAPDDVSRGIADGYSGVEGATSYSLPLSSSAPRPYLGPTLEQQKMKAVSDPVSMIRKIASIHINYSQVGLDDRYKTVLCNAVKNGFDCAHGLFCSFAHSMAELVAYNTSGVGSNNKLFKAEICNTVASKRFCKHHEYNGRCRYIHPDDLAIVYNRASSGPQMSGFYIQPRVREWLLTSSSVPHHTRTLPGALPVPSSSAGPVRALEDAPPLSSSRVSLLSRSTHPASAEQTRLVATPVRESRVDQTVALFVSARHSLPAPMPLALQRSQAKTQP